MDEELFCRALFPLPLHTIFAITSASYKTLISFSSFQELAPMRAVLALVVLSLSLMYETSALHAVGVSTRLQSSRRLTLTALRVNPGDADSASGFKVTDVGAASAEQPRAEDEKSAESSATEAAPGSIFAQRPLTSESLSDRVTELKTSDDPKQTRVILYILVSLVPVLFLVPLMLGRELVPLESIPPVEL